MNKKVISYSLWGNSKLYCQGFLDNLELAKLIYPDWTVKVYIAEDCPVIKILDNSKICDFIVMPSIKGVNRNVPAQEWHKEESHTAMLWRFHEINNNNDIVIFRDADSRLSKRESDAVLEWLDSPLIGHRMHECRAHHNAWAMGGMWGIKPKLVLGNKSWNIETTIQKWLTERWPYFKQPNIFVDLYFIQDIIQPLINHSCMSHGFGHVKQLFGEGVVGEVVNENWRNEIFNPERHLNDLS